MVTAKAGPVEVPAETERRDLVCGECGYGVRVSNMPPRCPMCGEFDWRASARKEEGAEQSELERGAVALRRG
jgi:primosomal protein N'